MAGRTRTVSVDSVVARVFAAIVGGYLLANVGSIALSYLVAGPKEGVVTLGLLVSFLIYACAVLWVFSVRTAWIAWAGLLAPGFICTVLVWWLMPESLY